MGVGANFYSYILEHSFGSCFQLEEKGFVRVAVERENRLECTLYNNIIASFYRFAFPSNIAQVNNWERPLSSFFSHRFLSLFFNGSVFLLIFVLEEQKVFVVLSS
jgi:hypothetical protein